jgi:hypothetical protein
VSRSLRFNSLDDLPPEMRRRVQDAEAKAKQPAGSARAATVREQAESGSEFQMQPGRAVSNKSRSPQARRGEEEHEQQVQFFVEIHELARVDPDTYGTAARRTYAIPNGGRRQKREAWVLVQEGVKKGVSDIHCAVARGGKHGLYIEMKSRVGRASKEQVDWMLDSEREGFEAHCCSSAAEALEVWKKYVDGACPTS